MTKCTLNLGGGSTIGVVEAPLKLAEGSYKVKIKVKLTDNSTLTDERDVSFLKDMPLCPFSLQTETQLIRGSLIESEFTLIVRED